MVGRVFISLWFFMVIVSSQTIQNLEINLDSVITNTMKTFEVPGMAVAVINKGEIVFSKGFGIKRLGSNDLVDSKTVFGIASNSKAFTAYALALLVDEGKIKWNDKVVKYIPYFEMYDSYVTKELTIRDLLIHNCGLAAGQGDLLAWPVTDFSREEIIRKLKYFKPFYGLRETFGYSNPMYMVAGEIIPAVTGKQWEDFVKERIFIPLGMNSTYALVRDVRDIKNKAYPNMFIDGKLKEIVKDESDNFAAGASIQSNIEDMSKWLMFLMNKGKTTDGKKLISDKVFNEIWKPYTIVGGGLQTNPDIRTSFTTYGLGWFLQDYNGYLSVYHTGGLFGMISKTGMIPELKAGYIILTNQHSSGAFNSVSNYLNDYFTGSEKHNWIGIYNEKYKRSLKEAENAVSEKTEKSDKSIKPDTELSNFAGIYSDMWMEDAVISYSDGKLYIELKRSPKWNGELEHYKKNTFLVKWGYKEFNADCLVNFEIENDKVVKFTLKPVSPLIDFSFNFQDLKFKRKN